jgi:hypothetical protein
MAVMQVKIVMTVLAARTVGVLMEQWEYSWNSGKSQGPGDNNND